MNKTLVVSATSPLLMGADIPVPIGGATKAFTEIPLLGFKAAGLLTRFHFAVHNPN